MKINFSLYHTSVKEENRIRQYAHNMSVVPRKEELICFEDVFYTVKGVNYELENNFGYGDVTKIWVFAVRNHE